MSCESLDPSSFMPPMVVELLLQHLTATDTLMASLVSKSWFNLVASSPVCMRKVNLAISGRKFFLSHQEEEMISQMQELSASPRRYENFTFYAQRPGYLAREVITFCESKQNSLKNVKLWSEKFLDSAEVAELMESLVKVESLELRNLSIIEDANGGRSFEFEKLKNLKLCGLRPFEVFERSFSKLDKLESLEIENGCPESTMNLIKKSRNLRELSLIGFKLDKSLFMDLTTLENLVIENLKIKAENIEEEGLVNFLKFQSENIKKLSIDVPSNAETLKNAMSLPKLEILHILTPPDQALLFNRNPTIKKLKLNCRRDEEVVLSFIDALPNLKSLSLSTCSPELENSIRKSLQGLDVFERK